MSILRCAFFKDELLYFIQNISSDCSDMKEMILTKWKLKEYETIIKKQTFLAMPVKFPILIRKSMNSIFR